MLKFYLLFPMHTQIRAINVRCVTYNITSHVVSPVICYFRFSVETEGANPLSACKLLTPTRHTDLPLTRLVFVQGYAAYRGFPGKRKEITHKRLRYHSVVEETHANLQFNIIFFSRKNIRLMISQRCVCVSL